MDCSQCGAVGSVEVKSVFPGGRQQPLPHDGLGGVVGQLEVVDARVDAGVGAVGGVNFPHKGQARVQIGQSAWKQTRS